MVGSESDYVRPEHRDRIRDLFPAARFARIPGAGHWPRFLRNRSDQFESRLVMVEVLPSPSLFLDGMQGSRMPVALAHGEGRAAAR